MASGALGRFARFYNTNFDRRPIPTLIVTNGVLYTISDVLVSITSLDARNRFADQISRLSRQNPS